MFACAPQTVQLVTPDGDTGGQMVFRNDEGNTALSVLEVIGTGYRILLTFNTRGQLVSQQWSGELVDRRRVEPPAAPEAVLPPAEPEQTKGEDDGKESEVQGQDHSAEAGGQVEPA